MLLYCGSNVFTTEVMIIVVVTVIVGVVAPVGIIGGRVNHGRRTRSDVKHPYRGHIMLKRCTFGTIIPIGHSQTEALLPVA